MKQLPWADEQKAREARHKALLFLRDVEFYSFRQIGRALNMSKVEAEQRYRKAKRQACFYCDNIRRGASMKHRGQPGSELCEQCFNSPIPYSLVPVPKWEQQHADKGVRAPSGLLTHSLTDPLTPNSERSK